MPVHSDRPAQPQAQGTATVSVSNFFYVLQDYSGPPDVLPDAGGGNGLIALGSTCANILTGTSHGPVKVKLEIFDKAPPVVLDGWDYVVEVSQITDSGTISVDAPFSGPAGLPTFNTAPTSWFRVRVHARGRDAGGEWVVPPPAPVEEHLIQIWPDEQAPEIRHKLDDAVGAIFRRPYPAP